MARWKSSREKVLILILKLSYIWMMWGLGASDVTAESDVGSAYTLPNSVFGY